jgi:hypothetical protein
MSRAAAGPNPPPPADSPTGKRHSLPSLIRRTTTSLSPSTGINFEAKYCPSTDGVGELIRFHFIMSATSIGRGAEVISALFSGLLSGLLSCALDGACQNGEANTGLMVRAKARTLRTKRFFFIAIYSWVLLLYNY